MFSSERLKGIGLFVCVADMGSFTLAAERLNLTASAVSKGIARLESRLQTKLFQRTTRRLALTDAGTQFYRTCTGVRQGAHRSSRFLWPFACAAGDLAMY